MAAKQLPEAKDGEGIPVGAEVHGLDAEPGVAAGMLERIVAAQAEMHLMTARGEARGHVERPRFHAAPAMGRVDERDPDPGVLGRHGGEP